MLPAIAVACSASIAQLFEISAELAKASLRLEEQMMKTAKDITDSDGSWAYLYRGVETSEFYANIDLINNSSVRRTLVLNHLK